jgi:hypothetical protein
MRFRLRTLLIVLVTMLASLVLGQDKLDAGKALYGEWEIVEMVFKGRMQQNKTGLLGWIRFGERGFSIAKEDRQYIVEHMCSFNGRNVDITIAGKVLQVLIEHKDDNLRIVWRNDYGERPKDFDAMKDSRLTLYVLKKVK